MRLLSRRFFAVLCLLLHDPVLSFRLSWVVLGGRWSLFGCVPCFITLGLGGAPVQARTRDGLRCALWGWTRSKLGG